MLDRQIAMLVLVPLIVATAIILTRRGFLSRGAAVAVSLVTAALGAFLALT